MPTATTKTALIVVDMLNRYEHEDAPSLTRSVRASLPAIRRLIDAAQEHEILTVWVNDNHGDWSADAAELADHALDAYVRHFDVRIAPDAGAFDE